MGTNRAAFTLYSQTLGFEIHDIEKAYYADKEDAYDMRKMFLKGQVKQKVENLKKWTKGGKRAPALKEKGEDKDGEKEGAEKKEGAAEEDGEKKEKEADGKEADGKEAEKEDGE